MGKSINLRRGTYADPGRNVDLLAQRLGYIAVTSPGVEALFAMPFFGDELNAIDGYFDSPNHAVAIDIVSVDLVDHFNV